VYFINKNFKRKIFLSICEGSHFFNLSQDKLGKREKGKKKKKRLQSWASKVYFPYDRAWNKNISNKTVCLRAWHERSAQTAQKPFLQPNLFFSAQTCRTDS